MILYNFWGWSQIEITCRDYATFTTSISEKNVQNKKIFNLWKIKGQWFFTLFEDGAQLKLPVEIMQPLLLTILKRMCKIKKLFNLWKVLKLPVEIMQPLLLPILKRMCKIKKIFNLWKVKGHWFCTVFEDRTILKLMDSDFVHCFEDDTKLKSPFDKKQPL